LFALVLVLTFSLVIAAPVAAAVITVGPGGPPTYDHATIQAAIDAASPYDTIIVHEGTYNENVVIQGFNGLTVKAADGDTVTVQATGGNVILVRDSSFVTIEGLTVTGGEHGIVLWDSHDCTVLENVIIGSEIVGIFLWGASSTGNTVQKNEVSSDWFGITVNAGDQNYIVENEISGGKTGISVGNSDDNLVSENEISSTEAEGILLYNGSTQNEIKENEISDVWWGIVVRDADSNELVENEISDSLTGISVANSEDNQVLENEVTADFEGIFLLGSADNNQVQGNEVSDSGWGIVLNGANDNEVLNNEVADSTAAGISAWWATGNLIKDNEVSDSDWLDLYDHSVPLPLDNDWEDNEYETSNF